HLQRQEQVDSEEEINLAEGSISSFSRYDPQERVPVPMKENNYSSGSGHHHVIPTPGSARPHTSNVDQRHSARYVKRGGFKMPPSRQMTKSLEALPGIPNVLS